MKIVFSLLLNKFLIKCIQLNEIKNKFRKESYSSEIILIYTEIESVFNNNIIELDSDYIITQISWVRRDNYKFNYIFGIFEGANEPLFKDPIPLAMIKDQERINLVNYLDINTPQSFKYIRYIPPNKNNSDISPIKIYGYKTSEKSENINHKKNFQVTNLPLIFIYTENSTEITEKRIDINCHILIINNGIIETNETAKIKVKDESKAYLSPKYPYSITFSSAQKILGAKGKYKKWNLISNYFDRSLLRNALALKISELMEFDYTVRCMPVDLILNGNFKGNYYICDEIEIGENRININTIDNNYTNSHNNTGGYLLEVNAEAYIEKKFFKTDKGIMLKIHYPTEDSISDVQEKYIIDKLNIFENEVYNGNLNSIDINTYSKYFLIEEFCGDLTHIYNNFYFTKKRGDDKFYFGPIWDFDSTAFDNDKRLIPTNERPHFCFNYYSSSSSTIKNFINKLIENKYVIEFIQKTWEDLCSTILNETILLDFIEEKITYMKESIELNFLKWDNFVEEYDPYGFNWGMRNYLFGRKGENFEMSVEVLRNYIQGRFSSLSNLIKNAVVLSK